MLRLWAFPTNLIILMLEFVDLFFFLSFWPYYKQLEGFIIPEAVPSALTHKDRAAFFL